MSEISVQSPARVIPQPIPACCPLCSSDAPRTLFRSERPFMQIVRCTACGMMYQNPRVVETEMADAYEMIEGYRRFPEQDSAKRLLFGERIIRLTREWRSPSQGSFLDFGAARGIMLDCVTDILPGWHVTGIELSPGARRQLLARGYRAVGALEQLDPEERFDWINMDNVLEHLPNPQAILRSLRSHLKPGGRIYIEVPNESFLSVRYRINDVVRGFRKPPTAEGHVNLFTPRTLQMTLVKSGLAPEQLWSESVSVPHRLKGALGADETPRMGRVLQFLRATRLDERLGMAYFICSIVRAHDIAARN